MRGEAQELVHEIAVVGLLGLAFATVACAPRAQVKPARLPAPSAEVPSDLRDAPAALSAAPALRLPPAAPARPLALKPIDLPRAAAPRRPAASRPSLLDAWQHEVRALIKAQGGFDRIPAPLSVSLRLRLDALKTMEFPGSKASAEDLYAWIDPVHRYFVNALERDSSLPSSSRRRAAELYRSISRSLP